MSMWSRKVILGCRVLGSLSQTRLLGLGVENENRVKEKKSSDSVWSAGGQQLSSQPRSRKKDERKVYAGRRAGIEQGTGRMADKHRNKMVKIRQSTLWRTISRHWSGVHKAWLWQSSEQLWYEAATFLQSFSVGLFSFSADTSSIWRQLTIDLADTLDLDLCLKECLRSGAHSTEKWVTGQEKEKQYIFERGGSIFTQRWWLTPTDERRARAMNASGNEGRQAASSLVLAGRRRRRRCLCLQPTNWLCQAHTARGSRRFDRERV